MAVRKATILDYKRIREMGVNFAKSVPFSKYITEEKIETLLLSCILESEDRIVLYSPEAGFLAGFCSPFVYGDVMAATELAWWVEEDKRNTKVGAELIEAFQTWAIEKKCKLLTMICLDDELSKYYERKGYVLQERAYVKEL